MPLPPRNCGTQDYHLTIDSNRLGWMRTAEIVLSAAR
jgi:hypothetical protein